MEAHQAFFASTAKVIVNEKNNSVSTARASSTTPIPTQKQSERTPAQMAADRLALRSQFGSAYGPFVSSARLSTVQMDTFLDLLLESDETFSQLSSQLNSSNLLLITEVGSYISGPLSEIDRDLETVLGPDKFRKFCLFRTELPVREYLKNLEGRLSYTNTPITQAQLDSIIEGVWQTGFVQHLERLKSGQPSSPELLQNLKNVLSAEQFAAYKEVESEKNSIAELQRKAATR